MATKKAPRLILLDSCSYFRLGISFRPILYRLTGDPEYVLKVLPELDDEFQRNSRLKTKFWWASQNEHRDERAANRCELIGHKANAAKLTYSYIRQYAVDNDSMVSPIDVKVLCVARVLDGIVVTDDVAMQSIAEAFSIPYFSTLDLLKLFHERNKASPSEIDSLLAYWEYEKDFPTSFAAIKAWRNTLTKATAK